VKIDLYERIWMWGVGVMLAFFFATLANASIRHGFHPPSHIETIDPRRVFQSPQFRRQGVSVDATGHVHVTAIGMMFVWMPGELTLPAETPVTFHLTSVDVIHGFEIVRSNGQTMVIPGYVSQFTTTFRAGEYLIACNEYCGIGHHTMSAKLKVVPKAEWQPPAVAAAAAPDTARAAGGEHAAH
jgi:cytochrome c oxidase subunit II